MSPQRSISDNLEQTWTYGETGNHTAITVDGNTLSLAHDDDDAGDGGLANEITEVNSSSGDIAHDAAGNMTKVPIVKDGKVVGHRKHTYDAWGRLVKVETDDSTPVTLATMKYDGLGRRIYKAITNSGDMNATYKFFYDGQRVIETHNGSDNVIKHKVWGPTYVDELAQVVINADPGTDDDMDDFKVALDDANFNVIGIMDDSHDLIERREYHPYGKRQVFKQRGDGDALCTAETPHPQVVEISGQPQAYSICDQGHQGLTHDKATGRIDVRTRGLEPDICRYSGRDWLEYIDGSNLYAYLMDSPLNWLDPWGLRTRLGHAERLERMAAAMTPPSRPKVNEHWVKAAKSWNPAKENEYWNTLAAWAKWVAEEHRNSAAMIRALEERDTYVDAFKENGISVVPSGVIATDGSTRRLPSSSPSTSGKSWTLQRNCTSVESSRLKLSRFVQRRHGVADVLLVCQHKLPRHISNPPEFRQRTVRGQSDLANSSLLVLLPASNTKQVGTGLVTGLRRVA